MSPDSLKNTQEQIFRIEDAKPKDMETLRTLVKDNWLQIYPNEKYGVTAEEIAAIDWYNADELEKRRKEIKKGKNVHTWVIKNEINEIVGFCKAKKDTIREIKGMYIVPGLHGKGLGKQLMQKALEWLGPDMDIRLKVVSYNSNAIGFYKKMGFKETGNKIDYDETKLPNGKEIPRIEMMRLRK